MQPGAFSLRRGLCVQQTSWQLSGSNHWRRQLAGRSRRAAPLAVLRRYEASVAAPPPGEPSLPPSPPRIRPLSWAFAASLLLIAVAALHAAWRAFRAVEAWDEEAVDGSWAGPTVIDARRGSGSAATLAAAAPPPAARPPPARPFPPAAPEGTAAAAAAEAGSSDDEESALVAEVSSLSIKELQAMNLELRVLIQQMEMQLLEAQAGVAAQLPPGAARSFDEASAELAEAEERLLELQAGEGAAEELEQVEMQVAGLQQLHLELLQEHADERDCRSYRNLLFNLSLQRQLLRQVEQQEGLRRRMEQVSQQLEALARQEQQAAPAAAGAGRLREALADADAAPPAAAAEPPSPTSTPSLRLASGGVSLPHPDKVRGEDAFCICRAAEGGPGAGAGADADGGARALGVADGVGGWVTEGVDPSIYPELLMKACEAGLAESPDPIRVLTQAHATVHAPGSCTVCLAALQPPAPPAAAAGGGGGGGDAPPAAQLLKVALLGDCGARLLRAGGLAAGDEGGVVVSGGASVSMSSLEVPEGAGGGGEGALEVVFATHVQQHSFNMPVQMGSPRYYPATSLPSYAARLYTVPLLPGDVLVMGTDGLFDNMHDYELCELLDANLQRAVVSCATLTEAAQQLAAQVAVAASKHSRDNGYASPFALKRHPRLPAHVRAVVHPRGGKPDDITVLVALVH